MILQEVIDGPLEEHPDKLELAHKTIQLLATYGLNQVPAQESDGEVTRDMAIDSRLSSWVEHEGDEDGHAVAFTVEPVKEDTVGNFSLRAFLFHIDRKKLAVVQRPQFIHLHTGENMPEKMKELTDLYDDESLALLYAMTGKAIMAFFGIRNDIDRKVFLGLNDDYIDVLAREYGNAPKPA